MPLLFDMFWEDLQTYEGTNPMPADFDDFWEKGLQEMDGTDHSPEACSINVPDTCDGVS